uniref:ras-associated and pleckstrin homology domains-containing protein 1-like isoform X2 n=1 Tax=Styela clava TaxID=7725 RepID=UPI00193ADE7A|nr:ras-associated and pleckstrin homology domains-containing protein 1-like isoform X2 [Styela clava]
MDTANLDAMFDDMLGELDIISQQLMDDTIDKAPPPKPSEKDTNRSSSYSQSSSSDTSSQSYTRPPQVNVSADSEVDIDLSAMLSDLTDWEHNLTSGQGQMPSKKSASQDSGIGFNGNSLPRNTNLSAQYGMDGSPQFSTLKRATTGGPSVTFGDDEDELSLQSLEKDMEEEKRKQDKSRQLSAEELAALSPVMQELDDLVSDLSNLSFEHEYNLKRKSNDKKDSKLSPGITNGHLPPQDHHDDVFNNHVPHVFDETEKSVSHDSKPAIPPCVPPKPQTAMPHVAPENASSVSSESKTSSSNTSVTRQSNPAFQEDISKFDAPDSPVTPNNVLNAARHFESAAQNQVQKSYSPPKQTDRSPTHIANGPLSPRQQQDNTLVNHQTVNGYPHQNSINNSKPPVPPPTALKPKVPDKPEEREERIKAEKMRIALEKLKEARIQKLVVKVFNKDDSSKTLVVDERMTTRSVVRQLLEKNHYEPSINWALIEELPSLFMERIFEEHESVTEMLSFWTRDTTNQVRFLERKDKYALFRNPQHYLLSTSDSESQMAERQKQTLVEEFFSGRSGTGVPEVQGILYVKGDSKSWSRKYCVLRTSGLYCSKSGEPKKGKKVSDLQCLVMFEHMCVYLGRGWKKKHKSPTDYGFALKHPAIQTKSKHIKYFCCDDVRSLMRWIVGIRCAKYGKQLKDNYDKTNEEMKATPVSAMTFHAQQPDTTSNVSTDSGEAGSRQNSMPRASLTNVFEGAWQRANQQESSDGANEGPAPQRAKSVWKPQQAKTNSNWWDLGAAPELEELVETTPNMSNRTSATSNVSSVIQNRNHRTSTSSTGSRGSVEVGTPTFVPPPPAGPSAHSVAPPPPMMNRGMEYNAPPSPRDSSQQPSSVMHKGAPPPPPFKKGPPPPPMKPMGPPQPQMKFPPRMPLGGFRPPMPGAKPHSGYSRPPPSMMNNDMPPPPPPSNDDLPPPPPMDDMPPPPPSMDDLPPPPSIEEDMPLPPPMAINSHPGLPKGLRTVDGQAPVRLPFLPMFKNGNAFGGMRGPPPPGPKPGGPPPPPKKMAFPPHNHNYSNNNAPPLMPRNNEEIVSNVNNKPKPRSPSYSSHSLHRKPSNPNFRPDENAHYPGNSNPSRPSLRAPLTHYYTSDVTQTASVSYTKDDFPPPPDFILDLKDTFYHINHNDPSTRDLSPFDLPPPPPELLLNQVKNRSQPQPPPQKAKPAPPPPKRSPSTRLSAKRR